METNEIPETSNPGSITAGWQIQVRRKVFVNTDPMRRCYNGAYASYTYEWSEWEALESSTYLKKGADPEERLAFWRGLNEGAVAARGVSAQCEFRVVSLNQN